MSRGSCLFLNQTLIYQILNLKKIGKSEKNLKNLIKS